MVNLGFRSTPKRYQFFHGACFEQLPRDAASFTAVIAVVGQFHSFYNKILAAKEIVNLEGLPF
jgi:hypothetical protein